MRVVRWPIVDLGTQYHLGTQGEWKGSFFNKTRPQMRPAFELDPRVSFKDIRYVFLLRSNIDENLLSSSPSPYSKNQQKLFSCTSNRFGIVVINDLLFICWVFICEIKKYFRIGLTILNYIKFLSIKKVVYNYFLNYVSIKFR